MVRKNVVTQAMKLIVQRKTVAKICTDAKTRNVFRTSGSATGKMTVETTATRTAVLPSQGNAPTRNSSE